MADTRITFNLAQVGKTWKREELPPPFRTLDPGSATFADAVATFQAAKGLTADGKLGANTLAAMRPPAPASTGVPCPGGVELSKAASALILTAFAEADKKVREVGKNAGPDVERYQKAVGLSKGAPWCAAFVSWCVMTSKGLTKAPSWCSGSAVSLFQMAGRSKTAVRITPADADFQSKVKPGMIWSRAQDPAGAASARKGVWCQGHTGIVVQTHALGFDTVEGNTNAAGSREGDGVYRKTHKWADADIIGKTVGWFDPETI